MAALREWLAGTLTRLANLASVLLVGCPQRSAGGLKVLLILGGPELRELECASVVASQRRQEAAETSGRTAFAEPDLLLLSSGASCATALAEAAGVDTARVAVDFRAVDTLSNFTSVALDLERLGCTFVYVATSEAHMRRAFPVGVLVLGSHGIAVRSWCCSNAAGRGLMSVLRTRLFQLNLHVHIFL